MSPPQPSDSPVPSRRARASRDLVVLGIIGVLLAGAVWAGVAVIGKEFYSASAFVERYLSLVSEGRAGEALAIPGVAVDSTELDAAGLPPYASDALLRRAAMAALSDVSIVSEVETGDATRVTVTYRAGTYQGTTAFDVVRAGQIGLAPTWRFGTSPLAVMDLVVKGSMTFEVNGFEVDKRQVSPDGVDADPLAPVAMLVFSPGIYSVAVDTAISATPGVAVVSDSPFAGIPVEIQAQATEQFVSVVQDRVDEFLVACATQQVLQPTSCPFGYYVQDRIASLPTWSIVQQPAVTLEPEGAGWVIPPTEAVAHIEVDIRSIFDGSIDPVSEDVPFIVTATITIAPDGKATITVGGPDTR
ncbi:hypothetical protein [Microbacterium sp.]|uniref:hypothetical protein n=1 Tax=Microbacterium sp. TaxID=51671 RepID=UPI003F6F32BE